MPQHCHGNKPIYRECMKRSKLLLSIYKSSQPSPLTQSRICQRMKRCLLQCRQISSLLIFNGRAKSVTEASTQTFTGALPTVCDASRGSKHHGPTSFLARHKRQSPNYSAPATANSESCCRGRQMSMAARVGRRAVWHNLRQRQTSVRFSGRYNRWRQVFAGLQQK